MRIAIIGFGPAAVKALDAIGRYIDVLSGDRHEVSVISSETEDPYAPMFLIKYITGQLTESQLFLLPEEHEYSFPFKKILGKRVVQIVEKSKTVVLEDGQEIGFDRLLIASGASPINPNIKGLAKKGVFFLRRLDEAKNISQALEQASDIVIVGAGAMGMEAAIAFNHLGKRARVVELAGQILPQTLGPNLARYAQQKLEVQGVEFWFGEAVSEIIGKDRAVGVVTKGGKEIKGDLILLTPGVQSNTDFLSSTAIKINRGIIVNDKMETNVPDVYAAGDVAESRNPYGDYETVFNWYSAISQGWVAGCNLIGQQERYHFCPMLSALKEIEFPVVSIGRKGNGRYEHLSRRDERRGVLEEVYVRDNCIDCYQAIGARDKAGLVYSFIKHRKRVDDLKTVLVSDSFKAAQLIS